MIRTLIVLALVAYGIRHSVRGPFYALLFYLWIAYFRPEQWVWGGVVQTLPLSLVVGVAAMLAALMGGQLTFNLRIGLVALLVVHSLVSTLLSVHSDFSWPYWVDFAKSAGITWLIASLVTDTKRFRLVLLVIALSLGFEATKQGWIQLLLDPGGKNYNEITFLGDNNAVAVAMYVLVAFLIALGRTSHRLSEKWVYRFMAVGSLYRGVVTYSRGGFLAGGAVGLFYLARSKRKLVAALSICVVGVMIVAVLPQEFWSRMDTMRSAVTAQDPSGDYEADTSWEGRLHFWHVAQLMAADRPIVGIGHNAFTQAYDQYDDSNGKYGSQRAVHSSWLGILSELGYPGLCLLILSVVLGLVTCRRARRLRGDEPALVSLREFGIALEISLVAIVVGGTFLIFQYTELLWHVVGLTIALQRLVNRAQEAAPQPVAAVPAPAVTHRAIAMRSA